MSHHTAIKYAFVVFTVALMSGRVLAAEAPRYETAIVAYGDLNLESKPGAKALYARLRNGAEDVCSSLEGRDLMFRRLWQSCFDQAVAAAVVKVDRPALTSLHDETVNRSKGNR